MKECMVVAPVGSHRPDSECSVVPTCPALPPQAWPLSPWRGCPVGGLGGAKPWVGSALPGGGTKHSLGTRRRLRGRERGRSRLDTASKSLESGLGQARGTGERSGDGAGAGDPRASAVTRSESSPLVLPCHQGGTVPDSPHMARQNRPPQALSSALWPSRHRDDRRTHGGVGTASLDAAGQAAIWPGSCPEPRPAAAAWTRPPRAPASP